MAGTQETYLKEIADAIREKEGGSGAIVANQFASRIKALSGGGALAVGVTATADSGTSIVFPTVPYKDGTEVAFIMAHSSYSSTMTGSNPLIRIQFGIYGRTTAKSFGGVVTQTSSGPSTSSSSTGAYVQSGISAFSRPTAKDGCFSLGVNAGIGSYSTTGTYALWAAEL